MTDRESLLRTVLENPTQDLPRLIYADWLEEHGQGDRANFIRVQIALHDITIRTHVLTDGNTSDEVHVDAEEEYKRLKQREVAFDTLPWGFPDLALGGCWKRGFIESVTANSQEEFDGCVHRLFAQHPVQVVKITNANPAFTSTELPGITPAIRGWFWTRATDRMMDHQIGPLVWSCFNKGRADYYDRDRIVYQDRERAYEAHSEALVKYGRSLADAAVRIGLPVPV